MRSLRNGQLNDALKANCGGREREEAKQEPGERGRESQARASIAIIHRNHEGA